MDRRAFIENLSKGIVGSAAAYRLTQGFPAVAGAAATQLDPVVETTAGKIQRFLMIKEGGGSDESAASAQIVVVQNWLDELAQRVPVP